MSAVAAARNGASVDYHVRRPGELERRRDDPGYMDWDIAREGILLYPSGVSSDTLHPSRSGTPARVRESPEALASVTDWLARADEDLRDIENNLAAGERASWSTICFHGQQAAEKCLTALLIQRGVRPLRSHMLDEIVDQVRAAGYAMPDLNEECRLLEGFSVAVRYPEQVPLPDVATGRQTLAAAMRIIDAAKALL